MNKPCRWLSSGAFQTPFGPEDDARCDSPKMPTKSPRCDEDCPGYECLFPSEV